MKESLRIVVFGLSLSSSWGNGHATTWRSLLKALAARGHRILFLECDRPWYAAHRDLPEPDFCRLAFYADRDDLEAFREPVARADLVIVGSFVPDGIAVGDFVRTVARGVTAFYDIDTPVTTAALVRGECDYLEPRLIPDYDLYLSFTGGPMLRRIETCYGSPAARPLYCSADPTVHRPTGGHPRYDLGYLGTYGADRQPALDRLLIEVARRAPDLRFVVAGPLYPPDIEWPANIDRIEHVGPGDHAAFYASQRFTLNVTRADMVRAGWSPSVRLFEAAACGVPIISDRWEGIGTIFEEDHEILVRDTADQVLDLLRGMREAERRALGAAGRARVLAEHTADHRAAALETHAARALERRAALRERETEIV